ncbi:CYIR protein [Plasmodium coatneyi]|uniref:CYIR protein n=1 Tax=Plasmodium coatneyi TaxID=208452 RepID=A0A1B1E6Z6_9APIC|nr:CYIR protein [Plasmodium coatneyi]ANQ10802.1 CYIR protein [Plasmodium coatneyi]
MEPAAGKKADLTADDLNRLPSKKAYAAFDHRYGNCGTYGVNVGDAASQLNSALNSHQNIKNEAEKILKAWCEASSQMTGSYASSSGLCQYFYFWLWDLLKNKLSDTEESPLSVMKTIYEKLNQVSSSSTTTVGGKEMCKIIYDNISDKEFFPQVKIHFDYSKDYLTITTQLGNGVSGGGVGTKACDTTYHDHLEAIKTACSAIEADCKEDSLSPKSGKYCDPLRAAGQQNEVTAGDYCKKEELQKLECQEVPKPKPNPNPNQASSSGSFSDADSGSAASSIAPAAGGLAAIGIPTVLFFLYKVSNTTITITILITTIMNNYNLKY